MRIVIGLVALVVLAPGAAAQPACDPCVRGDALIDRFGIAAVRPLATQLAALRLGDPLASEQYAAIVELRKHTPALGRLGALDDTDLALVASALCRAPDNDCTQITTRALTCLADRCDVVVPRPDPRHDAIFRMAECRSRSRRTTPVGLGFDWGNGSQRSGHPNDGRAWSFGLEGRWRMTRRIGAVARIDRTAGRDEAMDVDGNGVDDGSTGSITRVGVLAGPSFVIDVGRWERTTRFLRLDLLAGYLTTRTQAGEDGPAAGFDLGYQLAMVRFGARFVQGFAGAGEASMLLAHLGVSVGARPTRDDEEGCLTGHQRDDRSRLALGFEGAFGFGVDAQLGGLLGFGIEALWYLTRRLDAATRVDLLLYPGGDRDRVIHSALLAGARVDLGKRGWRRQRTGWFSTAMLGYSHGAGFAMTEAGSGAVTDLSLGWGIQDREGAAYVRLHGRFGLGEDNREYRAVFLSGGLELRLDSRRWRDRVRKN